MSRGQMHHAFIIPNIVDGAVVHKQAQTRLTDKFTGGAETAVHAHRYGEACTDECVIYSLPKTICSECNGLGRIKRNEELPETTTSPVAITKYLGNWQTCTTCDGIGEVRDAKESAQDSNPQ